MEAALYEIVGGKAVKYDFTQLRKDPANGKMFRLHRNIAKRWSDKDLALWGLYRPIDEREEPDPIKFAVVDEEVVAEENPTRVVQRYILKAINPDDLLREAKAKTIKWIDNLLVKISGDVPQHEKLAWGEKNKSARAFKDGTAEPSQELMLNSEAMQTGETVEALTDTIIAKADAYIQIIGITSGLRRSLFAQLDAAKPEDYDAILATTISAAEAHLASLGINA